MSNLRLPSVELWARLKIIVEVKIYFEVDLNEETADYFVVVVAAELNLKISFLDKSSRSL